MTYIRLALGIVQIAQIFLRLVESAKITRAAVDSERARQHAKALAQAAALRDIDDRFARMSDAEIRAALEGDFRD